MRLQRPFSSSLVLAAGIVICAGLPCVAAAQQTASVAPRRKALTVERIYSQPSFSGRLTRGLAWTPDGRGLSYFETKGSGKDAKTELWVMDAASGERRLLVEADKLESIYWRTHRGPRKPRALAAGLPRNINGRRMAQAFCFKALRRLRGWI